MTDTASNNCNCDIAERHSRRTARPQNGNGNGNGNGINAKLHNRKTAHLQNGTAAKLSLRPVSVGAVGG